ncbi:Uncharacterised protein [uncultured archaeon]|nr:Uncharacterised protein [uncultured archaeon]
MEIVRNKLVIEHSNHGGSKGSNDGGKLPSSPSSKINNRLELEPLHEISL